MLSGGAVETALPPMFSHRGPRSPPTRRAVGRPDSTSVAPQARTKPDWTPLASTAVWRRDDLPSTELLDARARNAERLAETAVDACRSHARVAETCAGMATTRALTHMATVVAPAGGFPMVPQVAQRVSRWSLSSSSTSDDESEKAWDIPALPPTKRGVRPFKPSLPQGWVELPGPQSRPVYVNFQKQLTSWTRPLGDSADRFQGFVVNVQKHFAFIRTDPPLVVDDRFDSAAIAHSSRQSGKHAKRAGDIFVYCNDVDFKLVAHQRVTFCLTEFNRRVKAVQVLLLEHPPPVDVSP